MSTGLAWVDVIVAVLLVLSGLLVLISAIGFLRLPDFFLRMHPQALAYTLGTWCVAGAATLYLSVLEGRAALHPLLLPVLLALTVPVTTVLLARSAEHTSELQSLMRISYAVFCLKKKRE